MSLSNPNRQTQKHIAPPVLGEGDLLGLTNRIILIEFNDDENATTLNNLIQSKPTIIISPCEDCEYHFTGVEKNILFFKSDRISQAQIIAKKLALHVELIIIDRVDMMNLNYDKKNWASQMKSHLSSFGNPNHLKGSNLIVTSGRTEYLLREIADVFHNLKH